ncbi:hypothetical protein CFter6_1762 [Collimonas fungivorans]|uniref:Uncharacterized protein n=1 Tax=Collimonas fungivorans TaxID=158899 RepID=A0A127P9G7_9BURK|nr:hypothetical protein CFter6_1762 [Collimonas fungivorans]
MLKSAAKMLHFVPRFDEQPWRLGKPALALSILTALSGG